MGPHLDPFAAYEHQIERLASALRDVRARFLEVLGGESPTAHDARLIRQADEALKEAES